MSIEFLDHAQDSPAPLKFVVYGRVAAVTPTSITLDVWHYAEGEPFCYDQNCTRHVIVRAAITKIAKLEAK